MMNRLIVFIQGSAYVAGRNHARSIADHLRELLLGEADAIVKNFEDPDLAFKELGEKLFTSDRIIRVKIVLFLVVFELKGVNNVVFRQYAHGFRRVGGRRLEWRGEPSPPSF